MNPGFQNLPLEVSSSDGRNFVLLKDAVYVSKDGTRYVMPAGATSDGASTPREMWNVLPPFGVYWPAAVLHDCAYRNTLLIDEKTMEAPFRASLVKDACDKLLLEAMESLGVNEIERSVIYSGVCLGGQPSFNKDRA